MNKRELKEIIEANSKPELAKGPEQMVYQVWEDGEVTLQKCGDLLWQRGLHSITPPMSKGLGTETEDLFDSFLTNPGFNWRHGYIFTDEAGTKAVRKAIAEYLGVEDFWVSYWEKEAK